MIDPMDTATTTSQTPYAGKLNRFDALITEPDRKDDWLPKARTEQAFADRQTVGWMDDSGFWGVSYPISGDTIASLKDAEAKSRG